MLQDELIAVVLQTLATKSEDGHIEFKAAREGAPKIYDTLSSFSNQTGGGVILFGIDERTHSICGVYDGADLQAKIAAQCLQMEPNVRAVCTVAKIDGKVVVGAEIPEIGLVNRPCYYKGAGQILGSYVRVGEGDFKMTPYEIYSYEAYRQKTQDELRTVSRAQRHHVETPYLESYLIQLSVSKPKLAGLPLAQKLELQGLLMEEKPTLAGILLFSEYPQSFFPRLCITAVVVPGETMGEQSAEGARFIDNQTIDGTISQMLSGGLQFVRRNMKTETIIDPISGLRNDKTEYPITAVRELILNALVHRDYSMHTDSTPITIVMYENRIEIENPGGLYGRLTLDTLGQVSADTRNPFLAGAMEVTKDTENRFSGIPTVRREMELAGLPQPVFENKRGVFKVTLYKCAIATPAGEPMTIQDEILVFCQVPRTRAELTKRFVKIGKTYLFTSYVNKLVAQGELQLGLPLAPRSKHQTYQTK